MTRPAVELLGVSRQYDSSFALCPISLSIDAGEFVVLLGPSGSGKTTLLSILGGFVEATTGAVHIDGVDVTRLPPAQRPTTTVFQDYALFPHMSVAGNIAFGPKMRGMARQQRQKRVHEMLDLVGLGDFGERRVHQLSGGQQQRVALARALAMQPAVLLLDEPLGALDLALRRQMQEELKNIQRRLGTTFVHVTHDQEEAMSLADRICVINQGRIEDFGPPDRVYLRPATEFSARFMGESNILTGRVSRAEANMVFVDTSLGRLPVVGSAAEGVEVKICLRPERVAAANAADPKRVSLGSAWLAERVFQGTHLRARARIGDTDVLFHAPPDSDLPPEGPVFLSAHATDFVLLGQARAEEEPH